MQHEADARLVFGREGREPRQIERPDIGGMDGAADRPFEARDVGKIGERRGRLEARQEVREFLAVVVKIGSARRMPRYELRCGALEEFLADETVNGRIGQPQRVGDAR